MHCSTFRNQLKTVLFDIVLYGALLGVAYSGAPYKFRVEIKLEFKPAHFTNYSRFHPSHKFHLTSSELSLSKLNRSVRF